MLLGTWLVTEMPSMVMMVMMSLHCRIRDQASSMMLHPPAV
jgi:hypothetical protein